MISPAPQSEPSASVIGKQITPFVQLMRPYERAIYLAALAFVYDPEEAVELARESALHAFKSLGGTASATQLKSWLVEITIERAKSFLREKKRVDCDDIAVEDEPDILDLANLPPSHSASAVGPAMGSQQTRDILTDALGQTPRKFRVVLFFAGCPGFYHHRSCATTGRLGADHSETTGLCQIWIMCRYSQYVAGLFRDLGPAAPSVKVARALRSSARDRQ